MSVITKESPLPIQQMSPPPDFLTRLLREGDPWSTGSATASIVTATGTINTAIATAQGPGLIGKALYLDNVTIGLDKPARIQFQVAAPSNFAAGGLLWNGFIGSQGGSVTVPVKKLLRAYNASNNGNVSSSIRDNLTAGAVTYTAGTVYIDGYLITDDFDYDADITILVVGDSINNGTGPTATAKMYAFLFKAWLLATYGIRSRIVLKSISGSTSTMHEAWRAGGWHDIGSDVHLILYALGTNDTDATAYAANLEAFWGWSQKRYARTLRGMVALLPGPLENDTAHATAETIRTAGLAKVAAIANPMLGAINLAPAFDRKTTSFFTSSDSAGSHTHPGDTGHAAEALVIETDWPGLGINLA